MLAHARLVFILRTQYDETAVPFHESEQHDGLCLSPRCSQHAATAREGDTTARRPAVIR
ncbi:hypothetical protein BIFANG_02384 [Bifidobacterium angulatum DSM 20098 = JCM 7096]|uniref:Uncharacterized protein n=1 Tax=Bifidobacterium angulatum DSM 20098 = JCM 7096 TaxID=518635 RepID=C4FDJ8_9BIFI|nr:hypothetical protein BIFANG_02384 [Bifidobacterium angulatum DSM 20098 = JCM 7096]